MSRPPQFPVQFPCCTSWAEPQTPSRSRGLSRTDPMETSWSTNYDITTRHVCKQTTFNNFHIRFTCLEKMNRTFFTCVPQGSDVDSAMTVYSETNTVTVNSLIPGSIYAFQIRARNERGYGPYSNTIYFTTLPLGTSTCCHSKKIIKIICYICWILAAGHRHQAPQQTCKE